MTMTATARLAPSADTFNALRQKLESLPYEYRVNFTLRSGNPQLGPIPMSSTFQAPRFNVMELLEKQYAEASGPLTQRLVLRRFQRLLATAPGLSWDSFCAAVAQLPTGQVWRHNLQGDLPGDPLCFALDAEPLEQLVRANRGKRGFTFSHYHPKYAENADLIAAANAQGFTINLVADSLREADELLRWQVAPVVVKVPEDTPPTQRTPAGHAVVTCPQTCRRDVTCATCQLCTQARYPHQNRDLIAFPIPGLKTADLPPDVLAEMM